MWRGRPIAESGTPVPHRDNEMRGIGAGPVKTYTMSPEEIAARYGPPGSPVPKKEEMTMTDLTKEQYLRLRAEGLTNRKIEKQFGMPANTIYPLLRKWNLTGVDAEKAQMLLDEMAIDNPRPAAEAASAEPVPEPAPEPPVTESPVVPSVNEDPIAEPTTTLVDEPATYQVSPATPRSNRTIRIDAVGRQSDIEEELLAMLGYVQALRGKSFRLELYLGEVAE